MKESEVTGQTVLVSGGGIAGATVAFWLQRHGFNPTVIERAPSRRDSGQNVDVRGLGRDVLRRMGIENRVRDAGTGEIGLRFVDETGRSIAQFPAGEAGDRDGPTAELEILRGDLVRILIDATKDSVEFRYGTSISSINQDEHGVDVTFADGSVQRFDLLIVAEGIRSTTRNVVFGAEPKYRDLGYYTAYFSTARSDEDDQWWRWYSATGGRSVQLRPDNVGGTRVCLNFPSPPIGLEAADRDTQARALGDVYRDVGYCAPRVLAGLAEDPSSLYVDRIAQVKLPCWRAGRVAVVGDAAYCATPISGMGTSLALIGAYLLAGELATHADHTVAYAAYEKQMRPIAQAAQKLPPGVPRIVNPTSRLGLQLLRLAVRLAAAAPVSAVMNRVAPRSRIGGAVLPEYGSRP